MPLRAIGVEPGTDDFATGVPWTWTPPVREPPLEDEGGDVASIRDPDPDLASGQGSKESMKTCTQCKKKQKRYKDFAKHDTSSDGRASICNTCRNKRNTERRHNNPNARLKHLVSSRVLKQFEGTEYARLPLTENLESYLGYTIRELRLHLDKQCRKDFKLDMLQCISSGAYHIDHTEPLSSFVIRAPGDPEFQKCWRFDNLKMITKDENLKKGSKRIRYRGDSDSVLTSKEDSVDG